MWYTLTFIETEINREYLETAYIHIHLCHTLYDQICKYVICWDAFTRVLTNTEVTLNEETLDDKNLSLGVF